MTPENLRALMDEHRLKPKSVAVIASVSVGCVYHWLKGRHAIPKVTWDYLLLKLGHTGTFHWDDQGWGIR